MSGLEILSHPKAVSMADEWFQYATADHFWMQWRHHIVARALKCAGGRIDRALEIGCGSGVAREMLERDFSFQVDGCDLNPTPLKMAKPGKGRLFIYNIFDQAPSLLKRYDAVFLLDVVEHIEDDTAFLTAGVQHLRPGGLLFVNVPAGPLFFSEYDRAAGHLRRYTAKSLSKLLQRCGVEVPTIWPWGLLMIPPLLARKMLVRRGKRADVIQKGFVPPNRIFREFLHGVKNIETSLPFPMPFGSSILAWGRLRTSAPQAN
jgi:SAM-dependent methyltransferase